MPLDCYNPESHTCDGRCQGASGCPFATEENVSPRYMKLYMRRMEENTRILAGITEGLKDDPEFRQMMEEFTSGVTHAGWKQRSQRKLLKAIGLIKLSIPKVNGFGNVSPSDGKDLKEAIEILQSILNL